MGDPVIVAVGGGKGGVGKSLISSGIATALALKGKSTVCVDLDLGGANLHTFFGFRSVDKGIGDFLFQPDSRNLEDYSVECQIPNLRIISGSGFIPGIANLYYFQKLKILRALKRLNFDFVVLDLGAGTSYNVIDFFSITRSGIVVTNPEPTAILNAYEFIKNVLFRIFSRSFKQGHIALEIIEAHKFGENQQQGSSVRELLEQLSHVDAEAASKVKKICQEFKPCLVLNMVRSLEHSKAIASNLMDICRNFLDIELKYLGAVPRDDMISKELVRLKNVMLSCPDAKATKAISELAEKCMAGFTTQDLKLDTPDRKVDEESQETAKFFETTGSEKDDLAFMLKRFFQELGKEEIENDDDAKIEFSPLDILEPRPNVDEFLLTPLFEKDVELKLENFDIPKNLRELLAFIAELTHIEKDVKEGNPSTLLSVTDQEIAHAWFQTGLILVEAGQFSTALRSFDRASGLDEMFYPAINNGACCLMILGQIDEALSRLEKTNSTLVNKLFPSLYDKISLNKAICLFHSGKYEDCLKLLEDLKSKNFDPKRIIGLKAHCLYSLNRLEKAATLWKECQGEYCLFNRAVALVSLKRYDQALSILDALVKEKKGDVMALALRAVCKYFDDQLTEAIETLERALVLEPFNVKLRALMTFFTFKAGLMDRAVKEADIIARLRPSNPSLVKLVQDIKSGLVP